MPRRKYGYWCSAINCKNVSCEAKQRGISFFSFPNDPVRSKEWVIASRRADLHNKDYEQLHKSNKMCSVHFEEKMFYNDLKNRLHKHAVPTLFNIPYPIPPKGTKRQFQIKTEDASQEKVIKTEEIFEDDVWTLPHDDNDRKFDYGVDDSFTADRSLEEDSVRLVTEILLSTKSPPQQKKRLKTKKILNNNLKFMQSKKSNNLRNIMEKKKIPNALIQFIEARIKVGSYYQNEKRYSPEMKEFALNVYFLGPKVYKFLSKMFHLPTPRSLCNMTQNLKFQPGLNDFIFMALTKKMQTFKSDDKYCALCLGEMSLRSFLYYVTNRDKIVGIYDDGFERKFIPAKRVIVLMIRGITSNWKQLLSFHFVEDSCSVGIGVGVLKNILETAIRKLFQVNLKPCLVITDQDSSFLQSLQLLDITPEKPSFFVDGQPVFFMFDVPYLLMSLRNNLINYDFIYLGKRVSWKDIEAFYLADKKMTNRLAYQLTDAHIYPNETEKRKIELAAEVISRNVAAALETYAAFNAIRGDAVATANFLYLFYKVFQLFDSSNLKGKKIPECAFNGSEKQLQLLDECVQALNCLKVITSDGEDVTNSVQCLNGWTLSMRSFVQLWNYLKTTANFQFLLGGRCNRDYLDDFFSSIQQQDGTCVKLTAYQFTQTFKQLFCANLFHYSHHTNCVKDLDKILCASSSLIVDTSQMNQEKKPALFFSLSKDEGLSVANTQYRSLNLPLENPLPYISGYLLKSCFLEHECKICLQFLTISSVDNSTIFTHFNYSSPSELFLNFIRLLEKRFLTEITLKAPYNVANEMYNLFLIVSSDSFTNPCGHFPVNFMLKLFVRLRIHWYLKFINNNLTNKK